MTMINILLYKLGAAKFFYTNGLLCKAPLWWPRARVYYEDTNKYSISMPIGNAIEHAKATSGKVIFPIKNPA